MHIMLLTHQINLMNIENNTKQRVKLLYTTGITEKKDV